MTKRTRAHASDQATSRNTERVSAKLLSRPILGSAATVFAIGCAVLGVLLVLGINGKSTQALVVESCQAGTPGCELRTPIHEHANFALFIRGQQVDLNQPQFLSVEGNDRSALAHVHEPRFDVVHVHRSRTTWDDFLTSIGFGLNDPSYSGISPEKTCLKTPDNQTLCASGNETFKFYVNGVKVAGIANTGIHDLDRVLISFGPEADSALDAQFAKVGDDACIPSERCPDRIPANEPTEPCTKSNNTCAKAGG